MVKVELKKTYLIIKGGKKMRKDEMVAKIKDSVEFNRAEIEDEIGEFEIVNEDSENGKVLLLSEFDIRVEVTWSKMSSMINLRTIDENEVF